MDGAVIGQRHGDGALPGDAQLADAGEDLGRTDLDRLAGSDDDGAQGADGRVLGDAGCGQQEGE